MVEKRKFIFPTDVDDYVEPDFLRIKPHSPLVDSLIEHLSQRNRKSLKAVTMPDFAELMNSKLELRHKVVQLFEPNETVANKGWFTPYFKVILAHPGRNATADVDPGDYIMNIYGLVYLSDLFLRRLGIRLLVVDDFLTTTKYTQDDCEIDGILKNQTLSLDFDPKKVNAVLFADKAFGECTFQEMAKGLGSTKLGSKSAFIAAELINAEVGIC